VTPQNTATTTANTDEMTENAPLIPQYHAAGAASFEDWAFLIPIGNAMPMKKPDGNRSNADIAMRIEVEAAVNACVKGGLRKMNAARTSGNAQIHLPSRSEHKLPMLEAINSTNNTTVNP